MKTNFLPLLVRMIMDRFMGLLSAFIPSQKNWNPEVYIQSLADTGIIERAKIVKSERGPFARIIARVTYRGDQAIFKMHKAYRYASHLVQASNELHILKILHAHMNPKYNIRFPKVFRIHTEPNEIYGIREYISGVQLISHPSKIPDAYDACITAFAAISSKLNKKEITSIPKRTPIAMFITFPVIAAIAVIKNTHLLPDISFMIWQFIKNISIHDMFRPTYVIAHRDLSPENIFVTKKSYGVIDAEVAALCEKGTDLSLFPRFYYRFTTAEQIHTLLRAHIRTRQDSASFIRLCSYYTLHYLAVCAIDDAYYPEARGFLQYFRMILYPMTHRPGGSVYEKTLGFLLTLPLRLGFHRSRFIPKQDFVLCYHSLSDDGKRYSTHPDRFMAHMSYLQSHTAVVPLSTMITGYPKVKNTRVSLTFDDGYRDTYTTAFPILSIRNIPSSVFVIGQTMKRGERRDTYLEKELMTLNEVKTLHENGWEIGFHTQSHTDLRTVTPTEIQKELTGSKRRIEEYIGTPLRYIAYPFGGYTNAIRNNLALSGFEAGFTTDSGSVMHSNPTAIPRVDVEGFLTDTQFAMLCSPYGLWISRLLMRALAGKIYIEQHLKHIGRKQS